MPDIVPMPFASRQWKSLVADNVKTARRTYETAVVATRRRVAIRSRSSSGRT